MRKFIASRYEWFVAAAVALCVCFTFGGLMAPASAAPSEPVPHCQPVQIVEPGHTFNVKACDSGLKTPALGKKWQWTVDGSQLQNGAVIFGQQIPKGLTAATASTTSTWPPRLAPCFNNHGVEFGTFKAWLCLHKLGGDPSGGFYFSPTVDDGLNGVNPGGQMVWTKLHAADGNYYVWENYSEPWGSGDTTRANGRIIGIDEGAAGQCIVDFPDWTVTPTECTPVLDGGSTVEPTRPMTAIEQRSVDEYITNARATLPLEYR